MAILKCHKCGGLVGVTVEWFEAPEIDVECRDCISRERAESASACCPIKLQEAKEEADGLT